MTKTPAQQQKLGIRCFHCGCRHFYTTHTEPIAGGLIRRRKQCRHCGRRIVTFEAQLLRKSPSNR